MVNLFFFVFPISVIPGPWPLHVHACIISGLKKRKKGKFKCLTLHYWSIPLEIVEFWNGSAISSLPRTTYSKSVPFWDQSTPVACLMNAWEYPQLQHFIPQTICLIKGIILCTHIHQTLYSRIPTSRHSKPIPIHQIIPRTISGQIT